MSSDADLPRDERGRFLRPFSCRIPDCTSKPFRTEADRDYHEERNHQRCSCGWCGLKWENHAYQLRRWHGSDEGHVMTCAAEDIADHLVILYG